MKFTSTKCKAIARWLFAGYLVFSFGFSIQGAVGAPDWARPNCSTPNGHDEADLCQQVRMAEAAEKTDFRFAERQCENRAAYEFDKVRSHRALDFVGQYAHGFYGRRGNQSPLL